MPERSPTSISSVGIRAGSRRAARLWTRTTSPRSYCFNGVIGVFREAVREFGGRRVRLRVTAMERASTVDRALLAKCFELGLMGIDIPESHGGAGGSLLMTVLAVEELSAVDASVAIFVDVQNTLVNTLLRKWASDDVKRRYLPRLATDLLGAYALSEPDSGSDAFGLQTRATRQGSGWIVGGRKLWITRSEERRVGKGGRCVG